MVVAADVLLAFGQTFPGGGGCNNGCFAEQRPRRLLRRRLDSMFVYQGAPMPGMGAGGDSFRARLCAQRLGHSGCLLARCLLVDWALPERVGCGELLAPRYKA